MAIIAFSSDCKEQCFFWETLSQATLKNIKQNLFFAFFYNILGIPLAALGFLNPVIAGAAMAASSVSVLGNALRLKRVKIE